MGLGAVSVWHGSKPLIWRNPPERGLGDSPSKLQRTARGGLRMNHSIVRTPDAGAANEPVRLARLRMPTRASRAPSLANGAQALLPDAGAWAELLGGGTVTAAECAALNAVTRVRLAPAGSQLHTHGNEARGLVALQEGDVALGLQAADADFRTEHHLHGPCWLDLSAAWLDEPHSHDARALTAVKLLELPREAAFEVADLHPALWRRLGTVLAREVRGLTMNTHDLMHKDAPARLAAWLAQHCQSADDVLNRGVVQLSMRKRDIASQLAITPETLSRLMRSFTGQGVIRVSGYTVHVLDRSLLERLAQS